MANGEYGTISGLFRPVGVGVIRPDPGGPDVLFTQNVVTGGEPAFRNLAEGRRVTFRRFPGQIGGVDFAAEVTPA